MSNHSVTINKTNVQEKLYTIELNHTTLCKLQGLLILVHNTGSRDKEDDKQFIRMFGDKIEDARRQGEPA